MLSWQRLCEILRQGSRFTLLRNLLEAYLTPDLLVYVRSVNTLQDKGSAERAWTNPGIRRSTQPGSGRCWRWSGCGRWGWTTMEIIWAEAGGPHGRGGRLETNPPAGGPVLSV